MAISGAISGAISDAISGTISGTISLTISGVISVAISAVISGAMLWIWNIWTLLLLSELLYQIIIFNFLVKFNFKMCTCNVRVAQGHTS